MISSKQIILSISTIFILTSCTHKTPYTNSSQLILMSSTEELALGEKSYKEVFK